MTTTYVYFLRVGVHGPVKIGTAQNPWARATELQTGNPDELFVVGVVPGNTTLERSFHQWLAGYRIRGEWFRNEGLVAELVKLVERLDDEEHARDVAEKRLKEVERQATRSGELEAALAEERALVAKLRETLLQEQTRNDKLDLELASVEERLSDTDNHVRALEAGEHCTCMGCFQGWRRQTSEEAH